MCPAALIPLLIVASAPDTNVSAVPLATFNNQFGAFSAANTFELNVRGASQILPGLHDLLALLDGDDAFELPDATLASFGTKLNHALAEDGKQCQDTTHALMRAFDLHHTDKASPHGYQAVYGPLLCHLLHQRRQRADELVTLEIGMGTNNTAVASNMGAMSNGGTMETRPGASLRAFRDVLEGARVYGADVDPGILFSEPRIRTTWVDQLEPASFVALHRTFGERAYDLVIDDGLHSVGANLNTLVFGLRHLRAGGFMVVEDIGPSYLPEILRAWHSIGNLLRRDPLIETCMVRTGRTGRGVVKMFVVHKRRDASAPPLLARACPMSRRGRGRVRSQTRRVRVQSMPERRNLRPHTARA